MFVKLTQQLTKRQTTYETECQCKSRLAVEIET